SNGFGVGSPVWALRADGKGQLYFAGMGLVPYTAGGAMAEELDTGGLEESGSGYVATMGDDLAAIPVLLVVDADQPKLSGDSFQLTVNIHDQSEQQAATGVLVTYDLPAGVSFEVADDTQSLAIRCTTTGQEVVCPYRTAIPAGGTGSVHAVFNVSQVSLASGSVTGTVTVTIDQPLA